MFIPVALLQTKRKTYLIVSHQAHPVWMKNLCNSLLLMVQSDVAVDLETLHAGRVTNRHTFHHHSWASTSKPGSAAAAAVSHLLARVQQRLSGFSWSPGCVPSPLKSIAWVRVVPPQSFFFFVLASACDVVTTPRCSPHTENSCLSMCECFLVCVYIRVSAESRGVCC